MGTATKTGTRLAATGRALLLSAAVVFVWVRWGGAPWPVFADSAARDPAGYAVQGELLVHRFQSEAGLSYLPLYGVVLSLAEHHPAAKAWAEPAYVGAAAALLLAGGVFLGSWPCALLSVVWLIRSRHDPGFFFASVQPLHGLLVLLFATLLLARARTRSTAATFLLGAAGGAALLCRSPLAFFPPVLALFEALVEPPPRRGWTRRAAGWLALPYLFLIPWIAMNWSVRHRFVPLEYGEADCNLVTGALGIVGSVEGDWRSLANPPITGPGQASGWALREVARHPWRYVRGVGRRISWIVRRDPLLIALALFGFWRGRRSPEGRALAVLTFFFLGLHCLLSIQADYLVPAWPLLWLAAARGLSPSPAAGSPAWARRMALAAAGVVLCAALAAAVYTMHALLSCARTVEPISLSAVDARLAGFPRDGWLWYQRGMLDMTSASSQAGEDFRKALAADPKPLYRRGLELSGGPLPEIVEPGVAGADAALVRGFVELREGRTKKGRDDVRAAFVLNQEYHNPYIRGADRDERRQFLDRLKSVSSAWRGEAFDLIRRTQRPRDILKLVRTIAEVDREAVIQIAGGQKAAGEVTEADLWLDKAEFARQSGDHDAEDAALERAGDSGLGAAEKQAAALALQKLGRYDRAENLLKSAAIKSPKDAAVLTDLGVSQYLAGHVDEAEKTLRGAVELRAGYLPAYVTLGAIYSAKKDYRRAREIYDAGLAQPPSAGQDDLRRAIRDARRELPQQ